MIVKSPVHSPSPISGVRYRILLLCFFLSLITYLDRVCISVAGPSITADLGLSKLQMGVIYGVFALAYGLFEIPMGWYGDRVGQRRVLTRIVACWSLCTAFTGLAWNYSSMLVTRFVFGATEAGAFPNLSRGLARWFPRERRALTSGVMWMGARLGGAIAPPLTALLISAAGWRFTFAVFGMVGLLWCLVFWWHYHDSPGEHPRVNAKELEYIGGHSIQQNADTVIPWRQLLLSGNLWALFWTYFSFAYGFYFFVTWLPTYLRQEHGLSLETSGFYAALPLGVGAVACLCGGALSDWLYRVTGNLKWSRRSIGMCGSVVASAGFASVVFANDPFMAVCCFAVAQAAHDLTLPVAWASCVDIGGRHGGITGGFMNMASSLAALISSISAGWLVEVFSSFNLVFVVAASFNFLGALMWLRVDPTQSLSSPVDRT